MPVAVLLVAAIVVAAVALRHAPTDSNAPGPDATTSAPPSPTSAATSPGPSASASATDEATPTQTPSATADVTAPASSAPAAPTQPTRAQTSVTIATAGWRNGAAAVSGYATVIEDGGTCTVTLTRGGTVVTGSRAATADATTTSCGVVEVRDPRLTAGAWQAVLSYSSPTSTGTSDPTTITIG